MRDDGAMRRHHFAHVPVLEGRRLRLRGVRSSDAAAIRDISFYDGVEAGSEREALAMLARIDRDRANGDSLHWGICPRGTDAVVGTCGFYRGFAGNAGEIGYVLREAYRGRGLMTEALQLVIDFGLRELELDEVVAYTEADNRASIRVLERLGLQRVPSDQTHLKFTTGRDTPSG